MKATAISTLIAFCILTSLLGMTERAFTQCTQTGGPLGGGTVSSLVLRGSVIYEGTNNGVYINGTQSPEGIGLSR